MTDTATTIILLCWIVYFLYWGISSRSVKPNQEVVWNTNSIGSLIGIIIILFVLKNTVVVIPHSFVSDFAGSLLTLTGLITSIIARRTLAGNWSKDVTVKKIMN